MLINWWTILFFFKRDPKGDLLWSLPWIAHVMNMSENYWHNWIEPDLVSCIMQSSISLKLSLIFRSWRGWLVNSCNWPIFLSWEDYRGKRFTHLISRRPNQKLFSPELQCGAIVNGGMTFFNVFMPLFMIFKMNFNHEEKKSLLLLFFISSFL